VLKTKETEDFINFMKEKGTVNIAFLEVIKKK